MLAAILSALIVDAAIETFWHGSPVRWVVLSIAVLSTLALAAIWQRARQARGIIAVVGFAGVLAVPAWLPGGLENGVRLLGLSTSVVLSLVAALGIAVGAVTINAETRLPRAARLGAAVLCAYGVAAFLPGILAHLSFRALLSGDSFWRPLPLFLQGALVGGVFVTSVSVVVGVIRAGIRHSREGTPLRDLRQIAATTTALAVVVAALPHGERSTTADVPVSLNKPTPAHVANLEGCLRAIEAGERESPRDRWDPDYVVERLGRDPRRIFAWVRDNTFWVPYHGVLRGPAGVLMDRQGNSLDRAVLLATLLQKAGHAARLAHAQLSAADALNALPGLAARRDAFAVPPVLDRPPATNLRSIASEYGLDGNSVQKTVDDSAAAMIRVRGELRSRVEIQARALSGIVRRRPSANDRVQRFGAAIASLQDHWWVESDVGPLDLVSPAASGHATFTSARDLVDTNDIPSTLHHAITIRVVTEQSTRTSLSQRVALEHTFRAADLIGKSVVLQFWPTTQPDLARDPHEDLRAVALNQHEWAGGLLVDSDLVSWAILPDTGDPPAPTVLGGLGSAMAGALRRSQEGATGSEPRAMTAVWIEYALSAPGEPPRKIRRVVYDVIGPARRSHGTPLSSLTQEQQLARSLSLMMRTEILPLTAEIAPEFVAHLVAASMLRNRRLFEAAVRTDFIPTSSAAAQLASESSAPVTPLYALALARAQWGRFRRWAYVDRVGILTRHIYPETVDASVALVQATDIVANDTAISLGASDSFALRLEQGVLDTNAESLLQGMPDVTGNTSDAFKARKDWVLLSPHDERALSGVSLADDLRAQIKADLAAGYSVVAAKQPDSSPGAQSSVGWWRIDSTTGDTLGIGPNGWGLARVVALRVQPLSEDGVLNAQASARAARIAKIMSTFAAGFTTTYGWCAAIKVHSAFANEGIHSRVALDALLSTPQECTGDAVFVGALVTLPLVAVSVRFSTMVAEPAPTVPEAELSPVPPEPGPEAPSPKSGGQLPYADTVLAPEPSPLAKTVPPPPPVPEGQSPLAKTVPPPGAPEPPPSGGTPASPPPGARSLGEIEGDIRQANADLAAAREQWEPYANAGMKRQPSPNPALEDQTFDNYLDQLRRYYRLRSEYGEAGGHLDATGEPAGPRPAGEGWVEHGPNWDGPPPVPSGSQAPAPNVPRDTVPDFGDTLPGGRPPAVQIPVRGGPTPPQHPGDVTLVGLGAMVPK